MNYYSAIKRNKSESVETRQMNREPVIQCKVNHIWARIFIGALLCVCVCVCVCERERDRERERGEKRKKEAIASN